MNNATLTLKKLIQPSRLDIYENIIRIAQKNGYIVTSLLDWYLHDFYPGEKIFLLRHDVDRDNEGTYKMYQIEKSHGALSSSYFRWVTMNDNFMKKMNDDGFEVSLHYETLATYCKKNNIRSAKQLDANDYSTCLDLLKNEISIFEKKYWPIHSLCSHGDYMNNIIGIPNHQILKGIDRKKFGIYFETYDNEILGKVDEYISDGPINKNHAWRYGVSPEEAIKKGARCITLLTHPIHWNYYFTHNLKRIVIDAKEHIITKRMRKISNL